MNPVKRKNIRNKMLKLNESRLVGDYARSKLTAPKRAGRVHCVDEILYKDNQEVAVRYPIPATRRALMKPHSAARGFKQIVLVSSLTPVASLMVARMTFIGSKSILTSHVDSPKKAHEEKIDSLKIALEDVVKGRARVKIMGKLSRAYDLILAARLLEDSFGFKRAKVDIPEKLITKACMWAMDDWTEHCSLYKALHAEIKRKENDYGA